MTVFPIYLSVLFVLPDERQIARLDKVAEQRSLTPCNVRFGGKNAAGFVCHKPIQPGECQQFIDSYNVNEHGMSAKKRYNTLNL